MYTDINNKITDKLVKTFIEDYSLPFNDKETKLVNFDIAIKEAKQRIEYWEQMISEIQKLKEKYIQNNNL